MKPKPLPAREVLLARLDYNPESGELTWKSRPQSDFARHYEHKRWNGRYAHKQAGNVQATGYMKVDIDHNAYKAHRCIWLMVYGEEPGDVDHINGSRADNRLVNLRSVSRAENNRNAKVRKDNVCGVPGIRFRGKDGRWVVSLGSHNNPKSYVGCFACLGDAIKARMAAQNHAGYHPNHGAR